MVDVPRAVDPRVTDALYLIVSAIVVSLSEEQRTHAREICDRTLRDPDALRMFTADAESEARLRHIVDGVFTGWTPAP